MQLHAHVTYASTVHTKHWAPGLVNDVQAHRAGAARVFQTQYGTFPPKNQKLPERQMYMCGIVPMHRKLTREHVPALREKRGTTGDTDEPNALALGHTLRQCLGGKSC
jgi:hypothetical protein